MPRSDAMLQRTTALVIVGALFLGAVIYFLNRGFVRQAGPSDASKTVFSFRPSDVVSFTFIQPSGDDAEAIRLERRIGVWTIVQPIHIKADQFWIQGIADGLANARVADTERDTSAGRRLYGLDPPKFVLRLQLQNGTGYTVSLGNKDFTGTSVYSIVNGISGVLLLPASVLASADRPAFALADRNVLDIDPGRVVSLRLAKPLEKLEFVKKGETWSSKRPPGRAAPTAAIEMLLLDLSQAQMSSLENVDANSASGECHNPALTVTAVQQDGGVQSLLFVEPKGGNYLACDPARQIVFRVNGGVYKNLSQSFRELQSPSPDRYTPAPRS